MERDGGLPVSLAFLLIPFYSLFVFNNMARFVLGLFFPQLPIFNNFPALFYQMGRLLRVVSGWKGLEMHENNREAKQV